MGDPSHPDTDLGPLISEQHLEKVDSYVQIAHEQGGKIECGGERLKISCKGVIKDGEMGNGDEGYFYPPTIITGLPSTSRVCQDEIFGPVVTVIPFETEDEVIEWANSVEYGLSASVWTENGRRGRRVADSLHVGTVWINCWVSK